MPWGKEAIKVCGLKGRESFQSYIVKLDLISFEKRTELIVKRFHSVMLALVADISPNVLELGSRGLSGRKDAGPVDPGHRPSASALGWTLPARWAGFVRRSKSSLVLPDPGDLSVDCLAPAPTQRAPQTRSITEARRLGRRRGPRHSPARPSGRRRIRRR